MDCHTSHGGSRYNADEYCCSLSPCVRPRPASKSRAATTKDEIATHCRDPVRLSTRSPRRGQIRRANASSNEAEPPSARTSAGASALKRALNAPTSPWRNARDEGRHCGREAGAEWLAVRAPPSSKESPGSGGHAAAPLGSPPPVASGWHARSTQGRWSLPRPAGGVVGKRDTQGNAPGRCPAQAQRQKSLGNSVHGNLHEARAIACEQSSVAKRAPTLARCCVQLSRGPGCIEEAGVLLKQAARSRSVRTGVVECHGRSRMCITPQDLVR